jgi:hypothetical protein
MLENDADRLASIKGLGGQLVLFDRGYVWAIFDDAGARSVYSDIAVNSTSPQLTMRTSDVDLLDARKRHAALTVEDRNFTVREHQAGEAPGWSVLVLNEG